MIASPQTACPVGSESADFHSCLRVEHPAPPLMEEDLSSAFQLVPPHVPGGHAEYGGMHQSFCEAARQRHSGTDIQTLFQGSWIVDQLVIVVFTKP